MTAPVTPAEALQGQYDVLLPNMSLKAMAEIDLEVVEENRTDGDLGSVAYGEADLYGAVKVIFERASPQLRSELRKLQDIIASK